MKDGMIQMLCNKKHLVALSIFIILIMITCTGCGDKNSIATTDFISTMESNNYYIKDVSDQYANYEFFVDATLAVNPTNEYQIEFYAFTDEAGAKNSYDTTKQNQYDPLEDSSSSNVSVDVNNYSKCSFTTATVYFYMCRVDNTMVYVKAPASYKKEIQKIIDKLGY